MAIFCIYLVISVGGVLPVRWMKICTILVVPIGAISKLAQLKKIVSNKSAGDVSLYPWLIASYNNLARIITNLFETKDNTMVFNLSISFLLNVALVVACIYYKPSKQMAKTKERES